jgi:membrane protease YdiL (CAAX protease family)
MAPFLAIAGLFTLCYNKKTGKKYSLRRNRKNSVKNLKKFYITLTLMALTVFSVVIPLTIFHSVFLTFILYYGFACLLIPFLDLTLVQKLNRRASFQFFGFTTLNARSAILFGLGHGIFIYLITIGAFFFFPNQMLANNNVISAIRDWGVSSREIIPLTIIMLLCNGLVEEIFWRGYIFEKLKRVGGPFLHPWPIIFLTAVFYTSYHLATILAFFHISPVSMILIFSVLIAGLGWGWLKVYFQNLWAPAIGHILATAGYMTVFCYLIS